VKSEGESDPYPTNPPTVDCSSINSNSNFQLRYSGLVITGQKGVLYRP
jgi:hypothetical protein